MKRVLRKSMWVVAALVALALVVWAFLPAPVEVDAAAVSRGPIEQAVFEEGRTRVRDRFIIAAPLAGQLLRVDLEAGDAVVAGQTVLAVIEPQQAELFDARRLAEAESRVQMAAAALQRAGTMRQRSAAELAWAVNERQRIERLHERAAVGQRERDDAVLMEQVRRHEYDAAGWAEQVAGHELEMARAALRYQQAPANEAPAGRLALRSPVNGQVLRVMQESASPVQPGTAILEIGQVADLEVVMEVLSREAVRIRPGNLVRFVQWGGQETLQGTIRRVEPSAFTKVSALGVEEQRVNVVADLLDPPADHRLGDGYRVDARIIVDERADVLRVPVGALFRYGDSWAVFAIEEETARLRPVEIGLRSSIDAEVLDGLESGERVIIYPTDQVADGIRVTPR